MKEVLLKTSILKEDYKGALKNFFSRTQSLLMDKVIKNKKGPELVTSHFSDYKTNLYIDGVMWSSFWVILKIKSADLCKSIHDIINYYTSICPFEYGKCGKEGKKFHTFEYLETEKSFLNEKKKHVS